MRCFREAHRIPWRILFAMAPLAAKPNFIKRALRLLDQGDDAPPQQVWTDSPSFSTVPVFAKDSF
jgi:hypothetical protein